ncbi:MAG: type II toxin-antitoxin system VapC family toxin [Thiobacillus sp.]|nr:type II toxin-antitoxin system VapC family toxin [Thiobacillus sp.]
MILFLDTSALVKLYIVETDSPAIHEAVTRAETVAVCRIAWAEACAALARRAREVPVDEAATIAARQALTQDWPHFFIVEVTQAVVERACEFAETFALRGYDSVQLAAASEILAAAPGEVGFACFDNRLNKAAKVLGFDRP